MPDTKREILCGWGRYPVTECLSFRPEKRRDLAQILREHEGPALARGKGRSYGDAALQPYGVVRTDRLNHIIAFDREAGIVHARAGVTLSELMEICIPAGWLPPVLPGTSEASLGGAFACNVHGKNHWQDGDFAEHTLAIRLTLAGGESLICTPRDHGELFRATAGGMGMTGIIEEVTLKLRPIASCSLKATTYRVDSFEDMIAAFEHYRNSADYMVGWIDHMARDDELGRGVFEAASHISADDGGVPLERYRPPRSRLSVPPCMPGFLLNRYSMALYNKWRFKKYTAWRQSELSDFASFFHPLDRVRHWNRLYGRRGFFQYQCLLPETGDIVGKMRTFLTAIHRKKLFSFLAVVKYHRDGRGMLPFCRRGYSIALDFPNTRRVRAALPQLDRWIADQGGCVYLAKDAMLTPELFRAMYGHDAAAWLDAIRQADPEARFTSLMSERLAWKTRA